MYRQQLLNNLINSIEKKLKNINSIILISCLLLVLCVFTNGHPITTTTTSNSIDGLFKELSQNKNLEKILLNKTALPFLQECTKAKGSTKIVCAGYGEMLSHLNNSKDDNFLIEFDDVAKILREHDNESINEFCETLSKQITNFSNYSKTFEKFHKSSTCPVFCGDVDDANDEITIKPMCKLISSGYKYIYRVPEPVVVAIPNQSTVGESNKPSISQVINEPPAPQPKITTPEQSAGKASTPLKDLIKTNQNSLDTVSGAAVANTNNVTIPILVQQSTIANATKSIPPNASLELTKPNADNHSLPPNIVAILENNLPIAWNGTTKPDNNNNNTQKNENLPPHPAAPEEVKTPEQSASSAANNNIIEVPPPKPEQPDTNEKKTDDIVVPPKSLNNFDEEGLPENIDDDQNLISETNLQNASIDNDEESDEDANNNFDTNNDLVNEDVHKQINNEQPPDGYLKDVDSQEEIRPDPFISDTDSNFFTYFMFLLLICIICYVGYHNKSKVLALVLEGRRSNGGRNGRRKHTAAYRKLDTNLEEAISSNSHTTRTAQIIY